MKIWNLNNWHSLSTARTDSGCFVGVAIGPESDEGIIRVDDYLLQAGRVLPLRGNGYSVSRVHGLVASFPTVKRLQLLLFEQEHELACVSTRADARFATVGEITGVTDQAYVRALTVPFRGREQAQVYIAPDSGGGPLTYQLLGRKFCESTQSVVEKILVGPVATAAVVDVAFYVGGVDNAESWDELAVEITSGDENDLNAAVDVTCIGEIGLG